MKDKLLNDLAELAGGAMGVFSALRQQIRDEVGDRLDQMTNRLDLPTRADLDRLEGMIAKLRVRLDDLEGHKKKPSSPKKPAARAKSAPKTTKKKK